MQYFDFSRLIKKYEAEFTLVTYSKGSYKGGEHVAGTETRETLRGAIIAHRESKIYRAEGTLTANDRKLYMLKPIKTALNGAKVLFNDREYSIEESTENARFTGVYAYTLKYVSAFKGGGVNG